MRITSHLRTIATLALAASLHAAPALAQTATPSKGVKTFASPELAANALAHAAHTHDESALEAILGAGPEVLSASDENATQLHRHRFAEKYNEMHRLVRNADGSTVLYVGAENWPFPFPLTQKNGKWSFDTNAGLEELLYRQVGQNELTAIDICRMLASPAAPAPTAADVASYASGANPDALRAHAQKVTSSPAADAAPAGDGQQEPAFYGYYFRKVGGTGSRRPRAEVVEFVAYPAEYRSSGVMTFLVTGEGVVYQKDLGPHTTKAARTLRVHKKGSGWTPVSTKKASTSMKKAAASTKKTAASKVASK